MGTLNPNNPFQSWILSPQEDLDGAILNSLQKQRIQNQIAQLAQKRISLKYDPTRPLEFVQEDAETQGQMVALQYLLTQSADAEQATGQAQIVINSPSRG